jgi:ubiquinone/menaquinone biosynthesis C-methylase UbiE
VHRNALYSQLAKYYDRMYWWKDYGSEVDFVVGVFRRFHVNVDRMLEVACGTGNHTKILVSRGYRVTGVDISKPVLEIARKKVKRGADFVQGDMKNLDAVVDGEYDAVLCLFSAISYNLTVSELKRTIRGFYGRLKEGGVVLFDTHFTKENFVDGYRDESAFDDGGVIGARISVSTRRANVGQISFTYLIKDGRKTVVLRNDLHRLGLFSPQKILRIMQEVGFVETRLYTGWSFVKPRRKIGFDDGIYVGRRPRSAPGVDT